MCAKMSSAPAHRASPARRDLRRVARPRAIRSVDGRTRSARLERTPRRRCAPPPRRELPARGADPGRRLPRPPTAVRGTGGLPLRSRPTGGVRPIYERNWRFVDADVPPPNIERALIDVLAREFGHGLIAQDCVGPPTRGRRASPGGRSAPHPQGQTRRLVWRVLGTLNVRTLLSDAKWPNADRGRDDSTHARSFRSPARRPVQVHIGAAPSPLAKLVGRSRTCARHRGLKKRAQESRALTRPRDRYANRATQR